MQSIRHAIKRLKTTKFLLLLPLQCCCSSLSAPANEVVMSKLVMRHQSRSEASPALQILLCIAVPAAICFHNRKLSSGKALLTARARREANLSPCSN